MYPPLKSVLYQISATINFERHFSPQSGSFPKAEQRRHNSLAAAKIPRNKRPIMSRETSRRKLGSGGRERSPARIINIILKFPRGARPRALHFLVWNPRRTRGGACGSLSGRSTCSSGAHSPAGRRSDSIVSSRFYSAPSTLPGDK